MDLTNKNMNTQIPSEDPILEWEAPQHLHHKRTRLWYITAALFVIGCLVYSYYTAAWSFAGLLVLLVGFYWHIHKDEPPKRRLRIWKQGYAVNDTFVRWEACTGHWILKGSDYYELHIEKKNGYETKIHLGDIDPHNLHDILSPLTPVLQDRKERILDTIIRICKL